MGQEGTLAGDGALLGTEHYYSVSPEFATKRERARIGHFSGPIY